MQGLDERVRGYIRQQKLLQAGDRVGVAVSGGGDSVALLRLLLELQGELGVVLSVVHFNHKLRGAESDADEECVRGLAGEHGLESYAESADVAEHACTEKLSVEAAARKLRYRFFRRLLGVGGEGRGNSPCLNKIATGHTIDDQAETVLLRVMRGTGLRGLSGIHPKIEVERSGGQTIAPAPDPAITGPANSGPAIIRPLLRTRRSDLEKFLRGMGQAWRDDSSNSDTKYTRNRVRQVLLPLMEREFNPGVAEALADLAEIARAEEEYRESHLELDSAISASPHDAAAGLQVIELEIAPFLARPLAAQRRLVRMIFDKNPALGAPSFRQIEDVIELAHSPAGKTLQLPGRCVARRTRALRFEPSPDSRSGPQGKTDYEYVVSVPGRVEVGETRTVFEALLLRAEQLPPGYNPDLLLDPTLLPGELRVRNWRAGDRYWPAHSKAPKKVKELLAHRQVSGAEKKSWPVVEVNGMGLVWMRGFPTREHCQPAPGAGRVLLIRESSVADPKMHGARSSRAKTTRRHATS